MSTIFDSMGIDSGIIIIVLLVIVVILIGFMISNGMRLTRLERKYKMFMKGSDAQSLEKTFVRKFAQIDRLYEAKEDHEHAIKALEQHFKIIFSKYGVEKYDAFDDVGGKLSFALALLDKDNTGLILNAVHSRDNCFLYLKEIVKGESFVELAEEEAEALDKAIFEDGYEEEVDKAVASATGSLKSVKSGPAKNGNQKSANARNTKQTSGKANNGKILNARTSNVRPDMARPEKTRNER